MTGTFDASQTVAGGQLRAFFERWQRLEEEKKTLSDDLKELFAEAKGTGFDTKTMRVVFRDRVKDRAEIDEAATMYDLYWTALDQPKAAPARPAHAHVEKIAEFPPHDTETGEIIEHNSSAPNPLPEQTDTPEAVAPASGNNSNSAGTAPERIDPSIAPVSPPVHTHEGADDANAGDGHEVALASANAEIMEGASVEATPSPNEDVPAFLLKDRQPSPAPNPDCQNPKTCRWSHSQASCARCATDAAIARQRGRAA